MNPTFVAIAAALAVLAARRTASANRVAVERLLAVRPQLVDVVPAHSVVPGLSEGTLLHAGPPISWDDCSGPLRGALIGAIPIVVLILTFQRFFVSGLTEGSVKG